MTTAKIVVTGDTMVAAVTARLQQLEAERDDLAAKVSRLEKMAGLQGHALKRYGPCSDHNGKVKPLREWECQWCRAERAERRSEGLAAALEGLLDHYVDMVNSGDCGFWDPENEDVVKAARAALAKVRSA